MTRNFFAKIYFCNKGIELVQFARLLRRFKNKIPEDFKYREPPTVIYTRSPTIGTKIFNYKQTIESIRTGDWKSKIFSCKCKDSKFVDSYHKHIVTGDLRIIANVELRNLLSKGPTYREPVIINWNKVLKVFKTGIEECQIKWTQIENKELKTLDDWSKTVFDAVEKRVNKLKAMRKFQPRHRTKILERKDVQEYLENFQNDFVFVPTDKASNNISIVCKEFYIHMLLKEVGFFDTERKQERAYQEIKQTSEEIIKAHVKENQNFEVTVDEKQNQLPILLWIPKMHKNPSKQRFIAASHCCTSKNLSSLIGKCLKLIQKAHQIYCERIKNYTGYNLFWIVDNSLSIHKLLKQCDTKAKNLVTYDFSTLYTSIPHDKLKTQMSWVIEKAFTGMNKKYMKINKFCARWSNKKDFKPDVSFLDSETLIKMIAWLIDNTYVRIGDKVFRQVIGIPMGTDCAPFLANLFLFSYEFQWMNEKLKKKDFYLLQKFKHCCRYIDDLFAINNNKLLLQFKHIIYPPELDITTDDESDQHVHYLDLDILIKNTSFSYCIYDKSFTIVNFPNLSGNFQQATRTVFSFHNLSDMLILRNRTSGLIFRLLKQMYF